MKEQNTQFSRLQKKSTEFLTNSLVGPWKTRSLGLLSLLIGFYFGTNLTVYFLQRSGNNRVLVVLIMVLIIELLVRLRTIIKYEKNPTTIMFVDNLRIGSIYAVVLEAFKLGS